jgi:hypothetical protein
VTETTQRTEQLYSAAARMMCLQDSPSWRNGTWSPTRSHAWRDLEGVLVEADPSPMADAARAWEHAMAAPDPAPPIAVQGARLQAIVRLLGELRGRLTPGRPAVTIVDDADHLAQVIHELADSLRAPGTGRSATPPPQSRAIAVPLVLPRYDVLARAAAAAAHAVPSPDELTRSNDFSVRHEAADAAGRVLALLSEQPTPVWTERHNDIQPDRHLVTYYRFTAERGRPVAFPEAADELRLVLRATRPPWVPVPADPLPESTDASWATIPGVTALVIADLLDELAALLAPSNQTAGIGFAAYSWFELLGNLISTLTNG